MIGYVKMSQFLMFCCATTFYEDFLMKKRLFWVLMINEKVSP